MKAKVLKKFKDIKTGEIRKKDDVFEASKKRFEEINKNGVKQNKGNLVEEFKEEDTKAKETAQDEKCRSAGNSRRSGIKQKGHHIM